MSRSQAATLAAGLFVLVWLAACSTESEPAPQRPPPTAPTTAAPTPSQSAGMTGCSNQVDAIEGGEQARGEVRGDVDGDGSDDVVYVVRDQAGPPGCQTFLVAETADGVLSTPTEEPDVSYALQAPRVNSLVQIDGSGGLEILVDLEQGASTQFLGMFTIADGALEKVRIGGGSAYGDLFPYGGSVGHIEASNCTDEAGADVLIGMATPNATDYTIRTVLYAMNGAILEPLPRGQQPPIATGTDVELSQGFDSSPFGECRGS